MVFHSCISLKTGSFPICSTLVRKCLSRLRNARFFSQRDEVKALEARATYRDHKGSRNTGQLCRRTFRRAKEESQCLYKGTPTLHVIVSSSIHYCRLIQKSAFLKAVEGWSQSLATQNVSGYL